MSTKVQIFSNQQFGEVRTTEINGKTYFIGSDVAKVLGYVKPQNAITQHCKHALKQGIVCKSGIYVDAEGMEKQAEQTVEMLVIPEGDIYRLVANSQLPGAEQFEAWIFDEVLPSIRRHGAYATAETIDSIISNPDNAIKLLTALKEEQHKRIEAEQVNEANKPKVLFADAVKTSNTCILIGELAKILKQNGIDIGQNRLFEWLRANGYLINRQGSDYNTPTQRAMELGLFEVKETVIAHSDGHISISKTSKLTGKGQIYFVNKFLSKVA